MKKVLTTILLIATLIMTNSIFASYTPTAKDEKTITLLKQQIEELSETPKDLRNFFYQFKTLKEQLKNTNNPKLYYLLSRLTTTTYESFTEQKQKKQDKAKDNKKILVKKYKKKINTKDPILQRCLDHYDMIDDLSFAYNFPTALTMATRYRESSCSFDKLPYNGDGPFQIVHKDYGTGTMHEKVFIQTVEDFINFSRNKYQRYQGKIKVNLDYTTIDLESVINHSALYNGGKKLK